MDVIDFLSDPVARRRSFLRRRGTAKKFDSTRKRARVSGAAAASPVRFVCVRDGHGLGQSTGWIGLGWVRSSPVFVPKTDASLTDVLLCFACVYFCWCVVANP